MKFAKSKGSYAWNDETRSFRTEPNDVIPTDHWSYRESPDSFELVDLPEHLVAESVEALVLVRTDQAELKSKPTSAGRTERYGNLEAGVLTHRAKLDKIISRKAELENSVTTTSNNTERSTEADMPQPKSRRSVMEQLARSGTDRPAATVRQAAESWSHRAASVMEYSRTETRALVSGSIDIPSLVPTTVVEDARPERLIDLLTDRVPLQGNSFEFLQQSARTNNADVVADSATKPTSVYTLAPVEDRARVIAHLSELVPNRIFADHQNVERFLRSEMTAGVLDALENQVVNGDGTGEEFEGILTVSGTTAVAFNTDIPTTLRNARTALQDIGEVPNAWVLSTADAEELDLEKEGAGGMYLAAGPGYSNIFGPHRIVVSTTLSAGTALLADWKQLKLFIRENVRLDIDTASGFETNESRLRAEGRFGLGVLRPAAIAVINTAA